MLGQSIYGIEPFGAAPAYVAPTPPAGPVGENALFLSSQPFDRATIVGSSEIPTLPASYLRDFRVERKWRLASKKDQYLAVTLDRALACDTVAIIGGNGSASFLGRILAATSLAALPASPEFDSGWMSAWPLTGKPVLDEPWPVFTNLFRFENTTAYRYWWLLLADPSAENSYMEYGRILIGKAFQPRFNVDINPALGLESPDVRRRSPFGRTFASPRGASSRRLAITMSAVGRDDLKACLFELQRYCGLGRDFVFSLDPSDPSFQYLYAMQAMFAESAQYEAQPLWDADGQVWRTSFQIVEPL